MIAAGMPAPAQIRASGGGTASPLWRQILADVLGAEIATVETTEGAAYGAGAPGGGRRGLVRRRSRPPRGASSRVTPVASPGPDAAAYAERHAVYRELYPALRADVPAAVTARRRRPPPSVSRAARSPPAPSR